MLDELLLQRYKYGYPDSFENGELASFKKFEIHDQNQYDLQKQLKYSWDMYFELKWHEDQHIYGLIANPKEAAKFIRKCIDEIEKIIKK